jgi:hypothetical protein
MYVCMWRLWEECYNNDSCEGKKRWPWNYFTKEQFVKENDDNSSLI